MAERVTVPSPTFAILGGALGTGNLGVSALGTSAVKGVLEAFPSARIFMQDWSDQRVVEVPLATGPVQLDPLGLYHSTSYLKRGGTRYVAALDRASRWLPEPLRSRIVRWDGVLDRLLRCDAVIDISGGDSLADLYGSDAFEAQAQSKLLVKKLGRPLVLAPQTYGPFEHARSIELVREIIDYSTLVAVRDIDGIEELRRLQGGRLHERVVCCPDMAFGLDALPVEPEREPFLNRMDDRPLIGLNVSGLLYLSKREFGLREPYAKLVEAIAQWAIERCGARLLLVPHVISRTPPLADLSQLNLQGDVSDSVACMVVMKMLQPRYGQSVGCLGWPYDAGQTKHFAGRCDFFIGARMHACIGAISQCVPTVTLAYSKKALGVLSHVNMAEAVVDLRLLSVDECMARLAEVYDRRDEYRGMLSQKVPQVKAESRRFFTEHLPRALGMRPQGS